MKLISQHYKGFQIEHLYFKLLQNVPYVMHKKSNYANS